MYEPIEASKLVELFINIKKGDLSSFELFYSSTFRLVFYKILTYVKNEETAKDLTQDVYFEFYKNIHKIKENTACIKFLFVVAKNKALDYLKTYKDEIVFDETILKETYSSTGGIDDVDLVIQIIRKEIKIKQKDIDLILLHVVNDYTFEEISKFLNSKVNTVITRYNRAMKKIKEYFEKKGGF